MIMKVFLCLTLCLVAAQAQRTNIMVPGEYMVVLRPGAEFQSVAGLIGTAHVAANQVMNYGTYLQILNLPEVSVAQLQNHPAVMSIEQSEVVTLDDKEVPEMVSSETILPSHTYTTPDNCQVRTNFGLGSMNIWHLIRTSNTANNQAQYRFSSDGSHADMYILDTGIDLAHPDMGGRASHDFMALGMGTHTDFHGHGTHVASLASGSVFGVASGSRIFNVKVLGDNGGGTTGGITSGVNHCNTMANSRNRYSIINMSLGGGSSAALEQAVSSASNNGHFIIAAAGNSAVDTSNSAPANMHYAIAIGASDVNDAMASFSNHGPLNDLSGPGVSTWAAFSRHSSWSDVCSNRNNCHGAISGTSMACPVVAGVVARNHFTNFNTMRNWLHNAGSLNGVVSKTVAQRNTPNRLVHWIEC